MPQEKLVFNKVMIRPNPEGSTHCKRWESHCGRFRIEWRNRLSGVTLEPAYYRPGYRRTSQGGSQWVMIGAGHHRTLGGAEKACREWLNRNGGGYAEPSNALLASISERLIRLGKED